MSSQVSAGKSKAITALLGVATLLTFSSISLGLLGANTALANSVASTSPQVGAVLAVAPNAVSITTTGSLLDQGNTLTVTDPTGAEVDDGSLTISDTTAVVGLKPLTASGINTVTYTLLSATDAPVTGTFTFLYNAPATISSPSATPTSSTPTTVAATSPPAKPAGTSSSANIAVIILFVIATLVGLFLLWYAKMIWSESRAHKRKKKR